MLAQRAGSREDRLEDRWEDPSVALGVPEVLAIPEVLAGPEGPEGPAAVPAGFLPEVVGLRTSLTGATAVAVVRQAPLMAVEAARWTSGMGTSGSPQLSEQQRLRILRWPQS